jgi:hypothetical protein
VKCYVYIDESGDLGIKTVRGDAAFGASPYFVLAAAVMPHAATMNARKILKETEVTIPKQWKHATDLNHMQTVYFCRRSASLNARFFAVISNKATLNDYASQIAWDPHKFYNKCSHYWTCRGLVPLL